MGGVAGVDLRPHVESAAAGTMDVRGRGRAADLSGGRPVRRGVARPGAARVARHGSPHTPRYVYPARHFASQLTDAALPRMGERLRLRRDFDVSTFPPHARAILRGLQQYGMFVADNGANWLRIDRARSPDPGTRFAGAGQRIRFRSGLNKEGRPCIPIRKRTRRSTAGRSSRPPGWSPDRHSPRAPCPTAASPAPTIGSLLAISASATAAASCR